MWLSIFSSARRDGSTPKPIRLCRSGAHGWRGGSRFSTPPGKRDIRIPSELLGSHWRNSRETSPQQMRLSLPSTLRPRPSNWTVCHIWGYDDPNFGPGGSVVHDPRFYSCIGNMVWLPTSLKGFTDSLPEVKSLLRVCAYYLYGFLCDHPNSQSEAQRIRDGWIPAQYPPAWPTETRKALPPGTSPFTDRIRA